MSQKHKAKREARKERSRTVRPVKRDFVPAKIVPANDNQDTYLTAMDSDDVVIAIGSAGTGKTFLSACIAADAYVSGEIDKIILTRPNVACGADMGHLPGTDKEKIEPWMHPYLNAMKTRMTHGAFECAIKNGNIEYIPLQLMRGASYDNAVILADESQNIEREQMEMLITRPGVNTRLFINGDTKQTDLRGKSGLDWLVKEVRRQQMPIEIVEFTMNDCVRSGVCRMFLEMIERSE